MDQSSTSGDRMAMLSISYTNTVMVDMRQALKKWTLDECRTWFEMNAGRGLKRKDT